MTQFLDMTGLQRLLYRLCNHIHFIGTCNTSGSSNPKTVTVDNNFSLVDNARVLVWFSNKNTYSSPALNVNGTGDKAIVDQRTFSAPPNSSLHRYCEFVYNSAQDKWVLLSNQSNGNIVYITANDSFPAGEEGMILLQQKPTTQTQES